MSSSPIIKKEGSKTNVLETSSLTEEQKQYYYNKFIKFKYGNVVGLTNGDFCKNSYIHKRIAAPFPKIRKITLRWGAYIDFMSVSLTLTKLQPCFQISYSNNTQKSFGSATGGNDLADIVLNDNEYIVKVSGFQREALVQIKFELNTGKVYGPYGSNSQSTTAYPFISSGSCLKDLHVTEGKAGPTIFVKFQVVLGVCPEWSSIPPSSQRGIAECWSELASVHEQIEKLINRKPSSVAPQEILEESDTEATEVVTDLSLLSTTSENPTTTVQSNTTTNQQSLAEMYESEIIDLRRSLAKCFELLQNAHVNAETQSETFNEKLYKSAHNLFSHSHE